MECGRTHVAYMYTQLRDVKSSFDADKQSTHCLQPIRLLASTPTQTSKDLTHHELHLGKEGGREEEEEGGGREGGGRKGREEGGKGAMEAGTFLDDLDIVLEEPSPIPPTEREGVGRSPQS